MTHLIYSAVASEAGMGGVSGAGNQRGTSWSWSTKPTNHKWSYSWSRGPQRDNKNAHYAKSKKEGATENSKHGKGSIKIIINTKKDTVQKKHKEKL